MAQTERKKVRLMGFKPEAEKKHTRSPFDVIDMDQTERKKVSLIGFKLEAEKKHINATPLT